MRHAVATLTLVFALLCVAIPSPAKGTAPQGGVERLLHQLRKTHDPRRAARLREALQRAWIRQGPASARLLLKEAARAQADGLVQSARALLDMVVRRWPDYAEGRFRHAFLLWQLGRDDAARAELDALLRRHPAYFPAAVLKIRLLVAAGERRKALAACRSLLARHPLWQELEERCRRLQWQVEQAS